MQEMNLGVALEPAGNDVNCDGTIATGSLSGGEEVYTMIFNAAYQKRLVALAANQRQQAYNRAPHIRLLPLVSGLGSLVHVLRVLAVAQS